MDVTYRVPYADLEAKTTELKTATFRAKPLNSIQLSADVTRRVEASYRWCSETWNRQVAEYVPGEADQGLMPLTTWAAGRLPCVNCVSTGKKCNPVRTSTHAPRGQPAC